MAISAELGDCATLVWQYLQTPKFESKIKGETTYSILVYSFKTLHILLKLNRINNKPE